MKLRLVLIALGLGVIALLAITALKRYGPRKQTVVSSGGEEITIIQDVPKDAIPPLSFPEYDTADQTELSDNDIVLGVEFAGDARAYPIGILNWHEIINETIGGQDIVVTYCPLCRSGVVFDRKLDDQTLTFGNTGALYESSLVMYDLATQSYWYQVGGTAIKGPLKDKKLEVLPSLLTSWGEWRALHPDSQVLSSNTGYSRNYQTDSYAGYDKPNSPPAFPVSEFDKRLPPKEKVVGIVVDGIPKAYPVKIVAGKTLADEVSGQKVEIIGSKDGQSAQIFFVGTNGQRTPAPVTASFWFAWFISNPDTLIFKPDSSTQDFSPQIINVPVVLHPVRSTSFISTARSNENIANLFAQTQTIWDQASIVFDVSIQETSLSRDTAHGIDSGEFQAIFDQVRRDDSIHIFFVKDLNRINGIALGQGVALVADVTSVNDFRATAHEIGHLLGLSHTGSSTARLLYRGVNGVNLIPAEINIARVSALNLRS